MDTVKLHDPQLEETTEYDEKLEQAIARNLELQQEMRKLISSWEAERSQLRTKIVQLEHSLVDVIERSNNPHRMTSLSEDKMRLIEEAKEQWSAQWNAERDQLMAELDRLKESE
jgi:hypothetical protein